MWRREPLVHEGRSYQIPLPEGRGTGLGKPLKMIDHPVRDRIPIFVAGTGPRNVENAARVADGWIPIFFWPERAAQVWNAPLAAGLAQRDPALAPLEVSASVTVAIGDDVEHLREKARPQLALYIGGMGARSRNFYNDLACRYGLEGPAAKIQDLYLAGHKDEAAAGGAGRAHRGDDADRPGRLRAGAAGRLPRGGRHAADGPARGTRSRSPAPARPAPGVDVTSSPA